MSFVNVHGEPIDLGDLAKKKKGSAKAPPKLVYHKGWYAVGWSPAQVQDARVEYEKRAKDSARRGQPMPPFDVVNYMRTSKPRKIRPKPYELEEAARECCRLAEKDGWLRPHPKVVAKGAAE